LPIILWHAIAVFRQPDPSETWHLLERRDPLPSLIDQTGSGKDLMHRALLIIFVCVQKIVAIGQRRTCAGIVSDENLVDRFAWVLSELKLHLAEGSISAMLISFF
jgi:hypothetical protein